jgi:thioredoxin reductase (NADPH)
MQLPVIIAVDGSTHVLDAVERELAERYARRYRIERAQSVARAVERLNELAQLGTDLALILVGQSLLDTTGGDALDAARRLHPHAKRALLVSPGALTRSKRADLIRGAMAVGRIDHFVREPGQSPDEVFHEAISGFLLEWARERRLVPQTVHIVGQHWSGRAYELRAVLESCAVPHTFCLADSDQGRELLALAGQDAKLPLMVLPDGTALSDPTNAQIAAAAGAPEGVEHETFDLLVVGAGPAGLSAAVYGAAEGLRVLVVDAGGIGGQVRSSSLIRNYLGFAKGVSGSRLAEQAYEQAALFGASFVLLHRATSLVAADGRFWLSLDDERRVSADSVMLATGASYRRLGVPALEELTGAGVFYGGSMSEAPTLAGKDVYVVGGGNSAGQAALHLARYAREVNLVVRAGSLDAGMSHYLVRAVSTAPNVRVRTETTISGGGGTGHLERLVLRDAKSGEQTTVPADALFVLIGASPLTEWLPEDLSRDEHGFLLTGNDLGGAWPLVRRPLLHETSIPGIFAAGDVRHGSVKRVAAAVGEGATAVQSVQRLIAERLEPAA